MQMVPRTVSLRSISVADAELLSSWAAQLENLGSGLRMDIIRPEYWRRIACAPSANHMFIIECEGRIPLGLSLLYKVDTKLGTAFTGTLIGNCADRGKGYGLASKRCQLSHAFNYLGLNALYSRVRSSNQRMLSLLKILGYKDAKWLRHVKAGKAEGSAEEFTLFLTRSSWLAATSTVERLDQT